MATGYRLQEMKQGGCCLAEWYTTREKITTPSWFALFAATRCWLVLTLVISGVKFQAYSGCFPAVCLPIHWFFVRQEVSLRLR